jgi:hypothetical protein
VAENGFEGNEKLASSGDRLRVRFGGLVLDYPTKLTTGSIYSRQERGALVQALSGFHRGGPFGDHRICLTQLTATW